MGQLFPRHKRAELGASEPAAPAPLPLRRGELTESVPAVTLTCSLWLMKPALNAHLGSVLVVQD